MHVHMGGVYGGCTDAYHAFVDKWGYILDANMTSDEVKETGLDPVMFFKHWGTTTQRRNMFEKAVMGEYFHIYRSFYRCNLIPNCCVFNWGF